MPKPAESECKGRKRKSRSHARQQFSFERTNRTGQAKGPEPLPGRGAIRCSLGHSETSSSVGNGSDEETRSKCRCAPGDQDDARSPFSGTHARVAEGRLAETIIL